MAGEVTLVERVHVDFAGLPERQGPLTVGQRNVLQWLGRPGTAAIGTTQWTLTVPDGTKVADVRAAFTVLLGRHESLRTTFELGGEPAQRVAGAGRLAMDVYRAEAGTAEEAVVARMYTRLRATPFDTAAELPLRVALWVVDGVVRAGVTIFSHLAFDIGGMALVGREFTRLLTDPAGAPIGPDEENWQPIDRAAWEHSTEGRRRLAAALRYWDRQLRTVPHCMYAVPTSRSVSSNLREGAPPPSRSPETQGSHPREGPPTGGTAAARRSPAVEIRSRAAALAVPHIAARTGTSPTMVVVAAFVAILTHRTRHRRCAFVALVGNRMGRHVRGYVGTLAGPSLVVVDADAGTFDELVRRTGSASLTASRHAVVDVEALNELARGVYHERGVMFTRDIVVNNIHHALGQSAAEMAPPTLDQLAGALAETTVKSTNWERVPQLLNMRIFRLDESAVTLRLGTASAAWIPPADLELLVRGMEGLLVAAAAGDVELTGLTGASGVEPVRRGPLWRYVDGCWVDLAQVRQLVAAALAPSVTSVFFEPGSDRLVGFVAGGGIGSIGEAHTRCVDALPGPVGLEYYTYTTITPHRYVLCASPPGDIDDHAAWREQPVLAEGTGRIRSG